MQSEVSVREVIKKVSSSNQTKHLEDNFILRIGFTKVKNANDTFAKMCINP